MRRWAKSVVPAISQDSSDTYDHLVVMPCFMPLPFFALGKAGGTNVDLFAFLGGALDPNGLRNVEVTWMSVSYYDMQGGLAYRNHRYT
jgi:hypothetical protein